MLLVTVDGLIHASNRAFAHLVRQPLSRVEGQTLHGVGWADTGGLTDYLRRCARSRSFVLGSASLQHDDGSTDECRCEGACFIPRVDDRPALVLLRLILKSQSSSRFLALSQQIAELSSAIHRRQRAEREAHEQRELLHVTLSSIGDAVIATDRVGKITFMNEVAEKLTGWSLSEVSEQTVREVFNIVSEDTRIAVDDPVAKVLASGQVVGLANHTLLIARDGTERPIDDSGAPIVDQNGRLHGVVLVFRDVTELRHTERIQRDARREAEAANRAKDEFLATLSHELRTPLNAILGWVRMLQDGSLPLEKRGHALATIQRNASIQARLVEDLLDVSSLSSGRMKLRFERVQIQQVITAAIDAIRPAADEKGLRLLVQGAVHEQLVGDTARLQQVFGNLLTNAVKFTPPGGQVSIEMTAAAHAVHIVVSDTGQGFPATFQPHIFNAFSQADASFTRTHGGLGLGLMIARRLVEAHGGGITAHSDGPGRGARFSVVLPVQ
jgi:PAS domain S-box-containing protein